jgi:hypothetical protein
MKDTYTYTARNVDNPEAVVTFTLENDHLRLSLPELLEKVTQVAQAGERAHEAARQLKSQLKPGTLKAIEGALGPVHVNDTSVWLTAQQLKVLLWQRLAGLRIVPMWLNLGRVDNPEAAAAFVNEVRQRKGAAPHPGRFSGPLDYWAGWAGLLLVIALLIRWSRNRA